MTTYSRTDPDGTTVAQTVSETVSNSSPGIIEEPRSIDALLKSKTYQGMTDAEIERIIAYKEDLAAKQAQTSAQLKLNAQAQEAMQEHWREQAERAQAAFDNAVLSTVSFQTYEGVGV